MGDYTAAAVLQVLIIGFLVSILLIGGFLILNLGLMSKRQEDRFGGRAPSDLNILTDACWPEVPTEPQILPAQEDENSDEAA
jgi:hypothetical protein